MTNDLDQASLTPPTRSDRAFNAHAFQCVGVPPVRTSYRTNRAFTLIELMVVIGIIVIALALAVPAFSFLTSARSIEAGQNVVSAMLGRARTEAINTGQYVGVFFFLDPKTDRTTLALTQLDASDLDDPDPYDNVKGWATGVNYTGINDASVITKKTADRVLFITTDGTQNSRPFVKIYRCKVTHTSSGTPPPVSPPRTNASASDTDPYPPVFGPRTSGSYVGKFDNDNWEEYIDGKLTQLDVIEFTTLPTGIAAQLIRDNGGSTNADRYVRTGLILFDPQGRLAYKKYFIKPDTDLSRNLTAGGTGVTLNPASGTNLYSSFGVVLYDRQTFINQPNFTEGDVSQTLTTLTSPGAYNSDEATEETWLDSNTTPLLVNRFTGTLMTGAQP